MAATRSWETQQRLQALNAAVRERDCFNIPPGTGTASQPIGPGTCYLFLQVIGRWSRRSDSIEKRVDGEIHGKVIPVAGLLLFLKLGLEGPIGNGQEKL